MIKHKLIVLTCFLLVIGIIESICAMNNVEYETYMVVLILGLTLYICLYEF